MFSELNSKTCFWVEDTVYALEMRRKIQQTMFVSVCELQTPEPEHGFKIKTDHFFASKLIYFMIFLMVKKKLNIL